ncbi:hypothetical protein C2845_PM06G33000 [Panicum miliaceum]|uniref:BHLH domain-containing protein n=1 Tax=Panicum miliaceum TaxID=4540 RepID=A0A3L6R934_PANMI|nr:hypothetical protein C2845_PM06G33000 [Panicum miliaceum]
MNFPGHAAGLPWCYPDDAGEAAAAGDATGSFTAMIADYSTYVEQHHYSSAELLMPDVLALRLSACMAPCIDDLFDLLWEEQGGGGAPGSTTTTTQPGEPCRWSPQFKAPPEVWRDPPSEDEMAAWLRAIVMGEELAFTDGGGREQAAGGQDVPGTKGSSDASATDKKEKLPMTEQGTMGAKLGEDIIYLQAGDYIERRRHKINEKLRTLQQHVPGCDKSNQASTLDQTIQYMKSLQQHVQAMSFGPARPAATAYPVVQPHHAPPGAPPAVDVPMMPAAPVVLAPAPTMVVPFGAMLQLPHYPAAGVPVIMPAAAAAPLYPAARAAAAPESARSSASHRRGSSSSHSKGKGGGSLRMKH